MSSSEIQVEQSAPPVTGWPGRYFEDFEIGDVYRHPLGRTVLPVDNSWMTLLTQNTAPIHFDAHYSSQTTWGKPLVDSTFTLALVTGQSVSDISQHVHANLGWDRVRLPNPVFEGDTIYSQSEVLTKRESVSTVASASSPCAPSGTTRTAPSSSPSNGPSWCIARDTDRTRQASTPSGTTGHAAQPASSSRSKCRPRPRWP